MRFFVYVTFLLMASVMSVKAAIINGKVVDEDGNPMEFVNVIAKTAAGNSLYGAVTGADGSFKITDVPNGKYTLTSSFVGYNPASRQITVNRANVNAGTSDRTSAFKFTYLEESRVENCFRAGLSVRPELVIGRLTAGLHFGVYLYDPIKNLEPYSEAQKGPLNKGIFYRYDINKSDGWLYTRASLKYEVTPHLLLAVGLKTHLQRAEFIEWGIGYRF